MRGQAQGFVVLVTYGLGMFVGAQLAGALALARWYDFWLVPAGFALLVLVVFLLSFENDVEG